MKLVIEMFSFMVVCVAISHKIQNFISIQTKQTISVKMNIQISCHQYSCTIKRTYKQTTIYLPLSKQLILQLLSKYLNTLVFNVKCFILYKLSYRINNSFLNYKKKTFLL